MEKYFLHRIQKENGNISKGIEVHDTLDSAVLSYHGRMKLAYGGNPAITFMSCKITDGNGNVLPEYNEAWKSEDGENTFFMHYIRLDGETFTKGIDVCASFDAAKASRHAQMEYGYSNPNHAIVSYVSCMITDMSGTIMMPETWEKQEVPEE
jgi:hypothetical protein